MLTRGQLLKYCEENPKIIESLGLINYSSDLDKCGIMLGDHMFKTVRVILAGILQVCEDYHYDINPVQDDDFFPMYIDITRRDDYTQNTGYKFKAYAPKPFKHIRSFYDIDNNEYLVML